VTRGPPTRRHVPVYLGRRQHDYTNAWYEAKPEVLLLGVGLEAARLLEYECRRPCSDGADDWSGSWAVPESKQLHGPPRRRVMVGAVSAC